MRDFAITALVFGLLPVVLFEPFLGIALWTWLSVMNPHRMTWGFAYDLPFAQAIAVTTLASLLIAHQKVKFPVTRITMTLFVFMVWVSITLVFAIHFKESLESWTKLGKTLLMTFVAFAVVRTEKQLKAFVWILTMSVAFFGIKGGIFVALTGGEWRVYGPPQSQIEDNTAISIALVMMVPLLVYLYQQSTHRLLKVGMIAAILLCIASIMGSYSRGAFVAVIAMLSMLAIKNRRTVLLLILLAIALPVLLTAMPQKWWDRMSTIGATQVDGSVQGRYDAWAMGWNLAKDRPVVGAGFAAWEPDIFAKYAPNPSAHRAPHSIYFQLMGEHGFVGLAIYLLLAFFAWRTATRIIDASRTSDVRWRANLATAVQVSMVGFFVGGLTVNITYWDVYYFELVLLVALGQLVREQAREAARAKPVAPPHTDLRAPHPVTDGQ